MRVASALAACLVLVACLEGAAPGEATVARLSVAGGAVTVAGPRGYCVDPARSGEDEDGAFVLLGPCDALAGTANRVPAPQVRAMLSATVAPAGTGPGVAESLDLLESYFADEAGRALLSREGVAETVTIRTMARDGDALILHVSDTSRAEGPPLAPEYWRALIGVGDRMVTLNVWTPAIAPLDANESREVMRAFLDRMRAVNRAGPRVLF